MDTEKDKRQPPNDLEKKWDGLGIGSCGHNTCNHLGEKESEYAPSSVVPFTLLLEPAGSLYNPPAHSKLLSLVILRTDGRLVRREPQDFRGETLG